MTTAGAGAPAQRSHEQPIAAAKARPANTAPEYGELMTKDQDLDVAVAILGGAACEPDQPAQQYVEDSEEHGTDPLGNGDPILRTC